MSPRSLRQVQRITKQRGMGRQQESSLEFLRRAIKVCAYAPFCINIDLLSYIIADRAARSRKVAWISWHVVPPEAQVPTLGQKVRCS